MLVVLTSLSTAAPLMYSGGCVGCLLSEGPTTISLVLQDVAVPALCGQKVDLLPVVDLILLGDETHQSCVVCKLHLFLITQNF